MGNHNSSFAVVTQVDDMICTQRFVLSNVGLSPSTCVMMSKDMGATHVLTPTWDLLSVFGLPGPEGLVENKLASNKTFLGVAVAIATLLRHDGMLEVEHVSLYSR